MCLCWCNCGICYSSGEGSKCHSDGLLWEFARIIIWYHVVAYYFLNHSRRNLITYLCGVESSRANKITKLWWLTQSIRGYSQKRNYIKITVQHAAVMAMNEMQVQHINTKKLCVCGYFTIKASIVAPFSSQAVLWLYCFPPIYQVETINKKHRTWSLLLLLLLRNSRHQS